MSPESIGSPTIDDVAAAAGVSKSTVSRALLGQQRVSGATQERVRRAALELGYVPNVMAAELAHQTSTTIGLMLRDASNPAYGLLFTRLHQEGAAAGLRVVSTTIDNSRPMDPGPEQIAALHWLMGLRVAALVVATGSVASEELKPFHARTPIIRAGRPEPSEYIHAVSYDEATAGAALARLVLAARHRSVAVLRTPADISYPEFVRTSAMIETLTDAGARVHEVAVGNQERGVTQSLRLIRAGAVSAVMCPNDLYQLDVIRGLAQAGLHAPEDYSITGCDGILPGIDVMGLTSYRIGVEQLAVRTIAHLRRLLDGDEPETPVRELVTGELLPGRTLAATGE